MFVSLTPMLMLLHDLPSLHERCSVRLTRRGTPDGIRQVGREPYVQAAMKDPLHQVTAIC